MNNTFFAQQKIVEMEKVYQTAYLPRTEIQSQILDTLNNNILFVVNILITL